MRLDSLIGELAGDAGFSRVTGFAIDNRKVAPGTIFGAFQGAAFVAQRGRQPHLPHIRRAALFVFTAKMIQ